jgi:hypothetical protein
MRLCGLHVFTSRTAEAAERWASGAADSRSAAEAIGGRLHADVRLGVSHLRLCSTGWSLSAPFPTPRLGPCLLDHRVSPEEERWGDRHTERLGRLQIDDQLGRRPLDGQVGGLGAVQDLVH